MKKIKPHIHFVGVKGVGMTPLAIIAKEAGFTVSGCDVDEPYITDYALGKSKIKPLAGFSDEHLKHVTLVVTTGAHGGTKNAEVLAAKSQGIPVLTQGEAVGTFMSGEIFGKKYKGISVTGTHGKTTTTGLLVTILTYLKQDPSYVIGTSSISSLSLPGHFGAGKYFVAEADEYATDPSIDQTPKFLWQHPWVGVLTNIELDHPDVYTSVDDVRLAFLQFAESIPHEGFLVACGDDPQIQKMLVTYKKRAMTYGFSPKNTYYISHCTFSGSNMFFRLQSNGVTVGEFGIQIPGEHNVLNATAAVVVALELGFSPEKIKAALHTYKGSKRRLEYKGSLPYGAKVYDDYAHHPTEIKKTLGALRKIYPKQRIICIFQPHTFSRTKILFQDFLAAFTDADEVVLTDIYASKREAPDATVSSAHLVRSLMLGNKNAQYKADMPSVVEYIERSKFKKDAVLVIMGAGDIYNIFEDLPLTHDDDTH